MLHAPSVAGPAQAWPLVFLHGFPFSREQWAPQVATFAATHRVVSYDLRGHGAAPVGPGPLMIEFLVDDLFGHLDALGIRRATLCGLSMGGYVALRAVDREPGRVHGLVLCDTRADSDSNEARLARAESIRAIRARGMEALAERLLPALFGKDAVATDGPGVATIRRLIGAMDPDGACQALGAMACRLDLTDRLSALRTPTLIVVGDRDTVTPLEASRRMHAAIPGSRMVVIPDAGHVSNLSNVAAFNAALTDFLQGLEGRPGAGQGP